jgi:hypothetical protein
MAQDTAYQPHSLVYKSSGLCAREVQDQMPPNSYLDFLNVLERDENALSSRFGTILVNRDPNGTPSGVNYLFSHPVVSLSRLAYSSGGSQYGFRYASLSDGTLWRRGGNDGSGGTSSSLGQGPYTQIDSGLSGEPFQTLVASCYASAQAYLFIADQKIMLRDYGIGDPNLWGIDPPAQTANSVPYSPLLTLIDDFDSGNTYTATGFSAGWNYASIGSIPVNSDSVVTDFTDFLGGSTTNRGYAYANNTLTIPPNGSNSIAWTELGFTGTPITAGEQVTVTFNGLSASFSLTGTAVGSGTLQVQYSINNGTTWVTFYSQSFTVPQAVTIGTVSAVVAGLGNLNTLQYRILASSIGTGGSGNVVMDASATSSTVSISVAGELADITNGMISVLSGGGGGNFGVTQTVYAQAGQTNLSFNGTQYEYNPSNLLRTRGGVGPGTLTDYVIATGFGFSIPLTATILGITVTLYWVGQHAGTGILEHVALYYSSAVLGTVKNPGTLNTAFYSNSVEGSSSDPWGAGLTPAIVNDPSFGFGVQIETAEVGSTDRSFLASWAITVTYSTGGGGGGGTTLQPIPIASIQSTGWDGTKYSTLTITTGSPHGISGNQNVSVYGCSNELCDGFYPATSVSTTTLTVPFVSVAPLSATGGTLYYYPGGIPSVCMLGDIYSTPYPAQLSAFGFYQQVPMGVTTFPIGSWSGTVATNSTASVGVTADFDLSINNQVTDDDLIVLTLNVSDPGNIANIRLQFDVNGSGYTSSYYYANISPAFYQGNVANLLSAYQSTQNQIIADTLGVISGQPVGSTTAQLQPSNISTGAGTWAAVIIPRGNFLPVGSAGQSGLDWTNITGWQLVIETAATAITGDGSATVSCNGLYLQWGYGPSSFAGVGYDYRYTYFDVATFTESSPSPIQNFSKQYGYLSSLNKPFYLRQAVQVTGQYSSDPQTTHLRMYRRGGTFGNNWLLIDQVPNITAGGAFQYKDVIADAVLATEQPLALDNDPPVTSSLVNPINTTLSAATTGPGQSIYSTYAPQLITVSDNTAVFVVDQTVLVGNASNLEEVLVIAGGTGHFSAVLRLQHNAGESVQVNSVPRQPCNLCALSTSGGQLIVYLAGDPNNPNYLYYSKNGFPENFSPAARIPVSAADDPIMAVINWRGTIICATLKTWYIIVGGASPYAQPTGAAHGLISQQGWCFVEGAIAFRANDGIRLFTGADGVYMTLPVEWVYQGNPLCIPPQAYQPSASQDVLAFYNNTVFDSFVSNSLGTAGPRYRMDYSTVYKRYRYDDVGATAMLWERDTNTFLVAKPLGSGYAIVQDWVGDYDDGGWSGAHQLVQTPINISIQTPYLDLGAPHNQKQFNSLETDVNTKGQTMTTTLLFDDGTVPSLTLPTITTTQRTKVQSPLTPSGSPEGAGQQAYRASIRHTMAVTVAPILYQEDINAAVLAGFKYTLDSYNIEFSSTEFKLVKEILLDLTSSQTSTYNLYAEGSTTPYFTFTLPAVPSRATIRVRFPALKMRMFRIIGNVDSGQAGIQWWSAPQIRYKIARETSGYSLFDVVT